MNACRWPAMDYVSIEPLVLIAQDISFYSTDKQTDKPTDITESITDAPAVNAGVGNNNKSLHRYAQFTAETKLEQNFLSSLDLFTPAYSHIMQI